MAKTVAHGRFGACSGVANKVHCMAQMKRPEAIASENIAERRQKFHCSNGQSQEWERNSDSDLASFRLALHVTAW
jgi:hypothetical protein